jgi:hypothetical protein
MVMKTFEINATGIVEEFLEQYQIWKDHNDFYSQTPGSIKIQKSTTGIPCFQYRDIHAINQCKDPLVVIDCLTEGKHAVSWFNKYDANKHYIIFANEAHSDLDLKISYTWITHYCFLFLMADTYNTPWKFCYYLDKEYKFDVPKPMRFVSTTGNVRPERTYLKDRIVERIRYKNFIFRYSGVDYGTPSDQFDVVRFAPGEFDPYTAILEKYYHSVSQTLPIHMYNQADFNLLVETDIDYQHGFFPTEKIVKSLITGMPFVLAATPYFLKYLKQLGFYTYSDLWDESYDDELDYTKRIDKIVDLCNNLDTFDWKANQTALELIGLKNRSNFLNLNRVIDSEFRQFEQSMLDLI